jgi:hypothetical protein
MVRLGDKENDRDEQDASPDEKDIECPAPAEVNFDHDRKCKMTYHVVKSLMKPPTLYNTISFLEMNSRCSELTEALPRGQ